MSDLLSAASLFLATLGLLYGAWYAEISSACSIEVPRYKEDRGPVISAVRAAYVRQSVPLAAASVAVVLILAPPLFQVLIEAVHTWARLRGDALFSYDAVKTMFCAVYGVMFGLAIHLGRIAWRLRKKLGLLESPSN